MSALTRQWKVLAYIVGILAALSINLYNRFDYVAFIAVLCVAISVTALTWASELKLYILGLNTLENGSKSIVKSNLD